VGGIEMKLDAILKNEKFIYGVYQGLLFTVGFVTLLSFQNCSKSLKANVVQQASKAGAVGGESVKCELDGKSLNDQESNYFYSSQQPPDGKTCDEIKGNYHRSESQNSRILGEIQRVACRCIES
jgi:hypothetical protein